MLMGSSGAMRLRTQSVPEVKADHHMIPAVRCGLVLPGMLKFPLETTPEVVDSRLLAGRREQSGHVRRVPLTVLRTAQGHDSAM